MSTITVHVPAVTEAPAAAIDLAERRGLEGVRLGLVDNGKPRAGTLLQMLGQELQETYGVAEVVMISKGSAGIPLDDDQVADLASRVDVAVTGLGDCGACSACSLQDALLLERAGVASTVLITEVFVPIVARFAAGAGCPRLPQPGRAAPGGDQGRRLAARAGPLGAVGGVRPARRARPGERRLSERHGPGGTGPDGLQPRRPRADAARNRQRVSDAALAVFAERGLSGTVAQVAERAAVGNATVFRHFATKDELLSEVATRWLAAWGEELDARVSDDAPDDMLRDLVAEVVERFRQNRLALDLLRAGDLDDRMGSARARVEARFTEALRRGSGPEWSAPTRRTPT